MNTELHWAAVCNDIPKTTKLLKLIGKQPISFWKSLQNIDGHTPEHCAKQYNNLEISKLLLEAEPRLADIKNNRGEYPLDQLGILSFCRYYTNSIFEYLFEDLDPMIFNYYFL